jgi:hypothetical protein
MANTYRAKKRALKREFDASVNQLLGKYRHKAKKRKLEFSLSFEDFKYLISLKCYICQAGPSNLYKHRVYEKFNITYQGIDRIDSRLGYVRGNVMPCCGPCNYMKRDLTLEEFIKKTKQIAKTNVKKIQDGAINELNDFWQKNKSDFKKRSFIENKSIWFLRSRSKRNSNRRIPKPRRNANNADT